MESAPFAEIEGLVVDPQHRREGIGFQLVEASKAWAQQAGYKEIRVRSNSQRKESHPFYERVGFERVKQQEVYKLLL